MARLTAYGIILVCLTLVLMVLGHKTYQSLSLPAAPAREAGLSKRIESQPKSATIINTLERRQLGDYSETVTRPLFFEGRHYPARAASTPVAPAAAKAPTRPLIGLDGVRLHGIVAGAGPTRALIEATPGTSTWRVVGDDVTGWSIVAIEKNSVRLVRDSQSATLLLYGFSVEN